MRDFEYIEMRRIKCDDGATFVPVCEKCFRFIKVRETITFDWLGQPVKEIPNADCKKCGPTQMLFEGYYE